MSRRAAAWTTTAATALLGIMASLSVGILNGWKLFGLNLFDLLDYLTANIMLPVGGLFTCLFVGWKLDQQVLRIRSPTTGPEVPHLPDLHLPVALLCPIVMLLVFLDNLESLLIESARRVKESREPRESEQPESQESREKRKTRKPEPFAGSGGFPYPVLGKCALAPFSVQAPEEVSAIN